MKYFLIIILILILIATANSGDNSAEYKCWKKKIELEKIGYTINCQ